MDKGDNVDMAVYALRYNRGACYHFAALTYYMLRAAGYEAMIINGSGLDTTGDGVPDAAEHYWNLVKVDGVWYHYDTLQNMYLKTDGWLDKFICSKTIIYTHRE